MRARIEKRSFYFVMKNYERKPVVYSQNNTQKEQRDLSAFWGGAPKKTFEVLKGSTFA